MKDAQNRKVQFLPPVKRYVNAIEARLALPMRDKVRVMTDLSSTIEARREAGESYEEIMKDMGTPDEVAAQFNEEMAPGARAMTPLRFVPLTLGVLALIPALIEGFSGILLAWALSSAGGIGVIGGADGPTMIYVTSALTDPWSAFCTVALFAPAALAAALLGWYCLLAKRRRAALACGVLGLVLWLAALLLACAGPFPFSDPACAERWYLFLLAPSMWLSALLCWRSLRR